MKKSQITYIVLIAFVATIVCAILYFFSIGESNNSGSLNYNPNEENVTLEDQEIPQDDSLKTQDIQVPEGASYYQAYYSQIIYEADKVFLNKPTQKVVGKAENVLATGWFDNLEKQGYVKLVMRFSDFKTDSQKRDQDVTDLLFKNDQQILVEANFSGVDLSSSKSFKSSQNFSVTLNGIAKEVPISYEVRLEDDEILATGSGVIKLSDFNLAAPSLANVYKVGDEIRLEFTIKARESTQTQKNS